MGVFKRYSEPARRAIFFARWMTLMSGAQKISSVHLLDGLLFDDNSRVETIFHLRENFPVWGGCPYKFEKVPEHVDPSFTDHSKMILAWTMDEVARLSDYWIDTEHLLLGILRDRECRAAMYLGMTGLTLEHRAPNR